MILNSCDTAANSPHQADVTPLEANKTTYGYSLQVPNVSYASDELDVLQNTV